MARLSYDSSSDDESLDREVVARRNKQKIAAKPKPSTSDTKENAPPRVLKATSNTGQGNKPDNVPVSLSKGTPLRRRKLGNPQAIDSSLFRKWSDVDCLEKAMGKEAAPPLPEPRASRLRRRVTRRKTPELSERSSEEPSEAISETDDDDVVIRRRRPQQKAAAHIELPGRKTEAAGLATELKEDLAQIEDSVEISAVIADDQETSEDQTSEFVTALSLGSDSESEFLEPDFLPPSRRSRSPTGQRLKAARLQPTLDPVKRESDSTRLPLARNQRISGSDREPAVPQTPRARSRQDKTKLQQGEGDDLENTFKKIQIYAEDLDDSPEPKPRCATQLDPVTPRKSLQPSPFKAPKIPPSPWKPEHREFWDAEIQNEWIDRHSPPKPSSPKKLVLEGTDAKAVLKKKYGVSPEKRNAKKAFDQIKETLAQDFLRELDDTITQGQLAELTASTGGMRIKWSTTLQSTAGRAHWKCREISTVTQQPDGTTFKSAKERRHEAWIELATKVLTNSDDLLNTVAHEFCHLAVFMLNGRPKSAHGPEFKAWGQKCMRAFGADRGIEVTTKHSYEIDYKFIWRCADCASEVHRHSKSVDPARQRCGRCRGVLEQVKPVPRAAGGKKTAYQEFVGTEMKVLKAEGKALSFKEMMAVVSDRWKALQKEKGAKEGTPGASEIQALEEQFEELGVVDLTSA